MTDPIIVNIKVVTTPTFTNVFTVNDKLYFGPFVRFVKLERGVQLEVQSSAGVWTVQNSWSEV
ncbi:MAG: hypothetical protein ABI162_07030 [Luteolibacter sp.]